MTESSNESLAVPAKSGLERILFLLSIGLGLGAVRTAPGTFGSLWGPLLIFGCQSFSSHPLFMLLCGVILFAVGIPICEAGIRHYQTKDPKHVVFDEIAAFPFVFLFVPLTWGTAIAGFCLFRFFDITKLWPIKRFEKLPGAWGVMSDDTVAGILAGLVLWGAYTISGPF